MVEADRGGEVHFGVQRLKIVGPAGDARYSAGVQETGFPDVLCKAMKATLWGNWVEARGSRPFGDGAFLFSTGG